MLQFSTCFEQFYARHEEVKLYVYSIRCRHSEWSWWPYSKKVKRELSQPVYCCTITATHREWRYHMLYTYNL